MRNASWVQTRADDRGDSVSDHVLQINLLQAPKIDIYLKAAAGYYHNQQQSTPQHPQHPV